LKSTRQVGGQVTPSHQFSRLDNAPCDQGKYCERYTWSYEGLHHVSEMPHRACISIWVTDLTSSEKTTIKADTPTCIFFTTPYLPETRHHITGPASAFILQDTPAAAPVDDMVLVCPLLGSHTTFDYPDIHDHWSTQTICMGMECRSFVHAPIVVVPSNPLSRVSVHAVYQLDGGHEWHSGGSTYTQGIHLRVDNESRWGQLSSWDLAIKHTADNKPRSICIKIQGQDHMTLETGGVHEGPWCFRFVDITDSTTPPLLGERLLLAPPPPSNERSGVITSLGNNLGGDQLEPLMPLALICCSLMAVIIVVGRKMAKTRSHHMVHSMEQLLTDTQ